MDKNFLAVSKIHTAHCLALSLRNILREDINLLTDTGDISEVAALIKESDDIVIRLTELKTSLHRKLLPH